MTERRNDGGILAGGQRLVGKRVLVTAAGKELANYDKAMAQFVARHPTGRVASDESAFTTGCSV